MICDSAGIYTISNWGEYFETYANMLIKYSDSNDTIISQSFFQTLSIFGGNGGFWQDGAHIAKSRIQENASFQSTNNPPTFDFPGNFFPNQFKFTKFIGLKPIWQISIESYNAFYRFYSVEEDKYKNTYLSLTMVSPNLPIPLKDKGILIIDSLGYSDGVIYYPMTVFGLPSLPENSDTTSCLTHHYGNQYFFASGTKNVAQGYINVAKMDSSMDGYCTALDFLAITTNTALYYSPSNDIKVYPLTLDSLNNETIVVTASNNIFANFGNCYYVNLETRSNFNELNIYPNPCQKNLFIENRKDASISSVYIVDVYGKQTKMNYDNGQIKTDHLSNGIYLIKVQSDKGEFIQKFIKE